MEKLRRHWPLILALVVAAALRASLAAEHAASPLWDLLRLDEAQYAQTAAETAAEAAAGAWWPDYIRTNAPGYAWFLTPLFALFSDPLPAVRGAQMILGLASVGLAYFLALRLSASRAAAGLAAILLGLYWPLMIFEQRLLSASLIVFLNLAGLTAAVRAALETDPKKIRRATVAAGLAFGLATLVVPTALAAALFVAAGLMLSSGGPRPVRARRSALFLLFALLPLTPVVIADRATSGDWFFLQTNGGLNFYIGNGPESDGTPWARPGGDWDELTSRPVRAGALTDADQDRWFTRAALSAAADNPRHFAWLFVRKVALSLSHREVYATIFPEFHRRLFAATRLPLVNFSLILALAVGALPSLRRRPGALVLLLYLTGWLLALIATVVSSRYRLPLAAGLCVPAGIGGAALFRALGEYSSAGRAGFKVSAEAGRTWLALSLGAGLSAALWTTSLPHEQALISEQWGMLAEAEVHADDSVHDMRIPRNRYREAAVNHARKAVAINPSNSLAYLQLAQAEGRMGQSGEELLELIRRATLADPRCSEAHIQYAYGLKFSGDLPGALGEARAAVQAAPQRVSALMALAEIAAEAGDAAAARKAITVVYRLRPGFAPARELEIRYKLSVEP